MDYILLYVYLLILIISICLLAMILIVSWMIRKITGVDAELAYGFFKNLIYVIFTGIALILFMELRSEYFMNFVFWTVKVPLTILLLLVFSVFGLIYLHFLDIIFGKSKIKKFWNLNKIMKKEEKKNLEKYLGEHPHTLVGLSIFVLITLEVVSNKLYLWQVFGILSAFISYILMMSLLSGLKDDESSGVHWLKIFISLFTTGFCGWVLVNIIPALQGDYMIVPMIFAWLIFMILPGIRLGSKK